MRILSRAWEVLALVYVICRNVLWSLSPWPFLAALLIWSSVLSLAHAREILNFLVPPGPQEAHKASPGLLSHISCSVPSRWLLSLAATRSRLLQLGRSSGQSGILLLSWDTWYDLGRAGIRSLPKGLEASKSQISPMVSFIQVGYLYLPPRNRGNSLTDENVFKSFVYAPSPRLLKPKTSFSKTISFSFHVRPSQRKWNQNSAAWQKVWRLLDTLLKVGKCFKRLLWLTVLNIKIIHTMPKSPRVRVSFLHDTNNQLYAHRKESAFWL